MDIRGAGKFHVASRSSVLITLLFILVVVSLIWNVRQNRLIEHARQQRIATERAKAEQAATEAARAQVWREKKAAEAAAIERMQQLYREIDNLSQISERLVAQPMRQSTAPSTTSSREAAEGSP
jgi:hypothetical protein